MTSSTRSTIGLPNIKAQTRLTVAQAGGVSRIGHPRASRSRRLPRRQDFRLKRHPRRDDSSLPVLRSVGLVFNVALVDAVKPDSALAEERQQEPWNRPASRGERVSMAAAKSSRSPRKERRDADGKPAFSDHDLLFGS